MSMQGENIPIKENHVRLSSQRDKYGIPTPVINIDYTENDEKLLDDFFEQATLMLEKSGAGNKKIRFKTGSWSRHS